MSEEFVTQEQVRQMLHVSKRKAKYLLDNGIIPCINTGKKTRQYRVKVSDIEYYMEHPYDFAVGMFPSGSKYKSVKKEAVHLDEDIVQKYYLDLLSNANDILSVQEISELTGYSTSAIYRWIERGWVDSMMFLGRHLIRKDNLYSFLISPTCATFPQKSLKHLQQISDIKHQMQLRQKKKQ